MKDLEKEMEEVEKEQIIEPLVDRIRNLSPLLSDYVRDGGDTWVSFEKNKEGYIKKILSFLSYNPPEKTYYFSIRFMDNKGKEYEIFEKDIEKAVINFVSRTFLEVEKKVNEFEKESEKKRNIFSKIKNYLKKVL
jgi:hypothetical protein